MGRETRQENGYQGSAAIRDTGWLFTGDGDREGSVLAFKRLRLSRKRNGGRTDAAIAEAVLFKTYGAVSGVKV